MILVWFSDSLLQFFVYFFYFTLLTVIYLGCSAFIIMCHYRNQSAGQEAPEGATATELSPMAAASDGTTALNGAGIKTWDSQELCLQVEFLHLFSCYFNIRTFILNMNSLGFYHFMYVQLLEMALDLKKKKKTLIKINI